MPADPYVTPSGTALEAAVAGGPLARVIHVPAGAGRVVGPPDEARTSADHLLLGHPVFVQETPLEDGEISLFQLNWDEGLSFEFGDGVQIMFFGDPGDIRAGRWDRLQARLDGS